MNLTVEPLRGRYELISGLVQSQPERLRTDDAGRRVLRWVALDDGVPVATSWARRRPDDRTFLALAGAEAATRPLARAAAEIITPLHANVPESAPSRLAALRQAGFEVENETERFRCRFDTVLDGLAAIGPPRRYSIVDVSAADPVELFQLDNLLRQDVPGTDGWRGDWDLFVEELNDPASYFVAVAKEGNYVGLSRIWHNEQPSFGLLAVRREHRGGLLAARLLRAALDKAAAWGHEHFFTDTSTSNRVVHPRLVRLADARLGRSYQMIKHSPPHGIRSRS